MHTPLKGEPVEQTREVIKRIVKFIFLAQQFNIFLSSYSYFEKCDLLFLNTLRAHGEREEGRVCA